MVKPGTYNFTSYSWPKSFFYQYFYLYNICIKGIGVVSIIIFSIEGGLAEILGTVTESEHEEQEKLAGKVSDDDIYS